MIIRIFRAIIPVEMDQGFENKFKEISVPLVKGYKRIDSLAIARPQNAARAEQQNITSTALTLLSNGSGCN